MSSVVAGHSSDSAEISDKKMRLRRELRQRLASFAPLERQSADQKIHQHLNQFLLKSPGVWGAYRAQAGEASLEPLWRTEALSFSNSKEIKFAFPRCEGNELCFYLPQTEDDFELGSHKILEPKANLPKSECVGILVPGVGFDLNGGRLGRGAGYYDRSLSSFSGPKIGIAYELQMVSEVPRLSHDVLMDAVCTEKGLLWR